MGTPSNKNIWFGSEETCKLCGENGTLSHILSSCKVALSQGRFTWRHNQVLRQIALVVDSKRKNHNNQPRREEKKIQFVKAGEKMTPIQKKFTRVLSGRSQRLEINVRPRWKSQVSDTGC